MESLAVRQQQINRQRTETAAAFLALWSGLISEWRQPGTEDRAWLMYSANYLFRTQGVRWAIDPIRLWQRLPSAPAVNMLEDLGQLDFVLLTHRHKDHLDLELVRELSRLPFLWVVPEHLFAALGAELDLPKQRVVIPKTGEPFEVRGIRITAFEGLHWEARPEPQGLRGVPATGYLAEFAGKRWLFPGDTRTYDASKLPSFGLVDGLFAHLWLGRASALEDQPPLQEAFCRFCLELQPRRIVLAHLREFGREAEEYWDESHAARMARRLGELAPDLPVEAVMLGESVRL